MAYASMSVAAAEPAATSPPCPDHMKVMQGSDTSRASDHATASGASTASDHGSGCKSGLCKCACAHAQGLAVMPTLTPALALYSPAVSSYRVPLAPDCATSFFRPPI